MVPGVDFWSWTSASGPPPAPPLPDSLYGPTTGEFALVVPGAATAPLVSTRSRAALTISGPPRGP